MHAMDARALFTYLRSLDKRDALIVGLTAAVGGLFVRTSRLSAALQTAQQRVDGQKGKLEELERVIHRVDPHPKRSGLTQQVGGMYEVLFEKKEGQEGLVKAVLGLTADMKALARDRTLLAARITELEGVAYGFTEVDSVEEAVDTPPAPAAAAAQPPVRAVERRGSTPGYDSLRSLANRRLSLD